MNKRLLLLLGLALVASGWLAADRTVLLRVRETGSRIVRPATPDDSVPRSVAEAEAFGARFPRAAGPESLPRHFAVAELGTKDRRCVDVDTANAARSGEFVGGPFQAHVTYWHQRWGKWWFVSGHPYPLRTPVQGTVFFTRLDTAGPAFVFKSETRRVRYHDPEFDRNMSIGAYFNLPARGKWMVVASKHDLWGCFILTL